MNKIIFILYSLLFLAGVLQPEISFSQKTINEASLVYSLSYIKNDAAGRSAENNSLGEIKLSIKPKQSKCETLYKSGKETAYFNQETNKGAVLKEMMGQELLLILTDKNWAEKNAAFQNAKFTLTDFQQYINGMPCKQGIASLPNGKIVLYYNPELILTNTKYDLAFPGVNGLPVKIEWFGAADGKSSMVFNLKQISFENIPQSKFDFPSVEKYKTMSFEEAKKSGKIN